MISIEDNTVNIISKIIIALVGCFTPGLVQAAETITYSYDAKGRLVKVVHSGTVNNGVTVTYTHDKADNRTNVTTTGSSN